MMADVASRFFIAEQNKLEDGEIVFATFRDYFEPCAMLIALFGQTRLALDLASDASLRP